MRVTPTTKELMVNHAKLVGRKDLYPYAVGAISGSVIWNRHDDH